MGKLGAKVIITGLMVSSFAQADSLFEDPQETQCNLQVVVRPVEPASQFFTKENAAKFIPTNMTPGNNSSLFTSQFESGIGQKVTDYFFNGDFFRSSIVGKMTTRFEKFSQTTILTAGKDQQGKKINLEFQIKAPERQAVLSYNGFLRSEFIYAVDQSSFKWTLSRLISARTTIAWTNIAAPVSGISSTILSLSHTF